jgi:hypothetical protein
VIETLGRVIDSAIYGWLARGDDSTRVRNTLEQAVHVLLKRTGTPATEPPRRRSTKTSPAPRGSARKARRPARGARP